MTATVRFHFDPVCPWAWQTSKWIREVERVRDIEIEWAFFSLREQNKSESNPLRDPEARGTVELRTLALVRRTRGNDTAGALYRAIGERAHERGESKGIGLLRAALGDVGLSDDLADAAMADDVTAKEVLEEHHAVATSVGCFGVPTIVLPTGEGIFGPVLTVAPTGEAAGELWDHFEWLTRRDYFFEMKRERGDSRPGAGAGSS
ncbi:MAG: DsbA family protein [Actinomycetota bacterium]